MKQLSLQSLLLIVAVVGISVAWWIQASAPPAVYYLHIFSLQVHPEHRDRVISSHVTTIGVSPGIPFHNEISNSSFTGKVLRKGSNFDCTLSLSVDESTIVDGFTKTMIVALDTTVEFSNFHYTILSKNSDPTELELDYPFW